MNFHIALLQALNGKLLRTKDKNTRREIQKELRILSKEERKRQQLAVTDVIKNADVVLTTLTGASSRKLDHTSFDLVIIDEAAQALEIACWIALLKVMDLYTGIYINTKPCIFISIKRQFMTYACKELMHVLAFVVLKETFGVLLAC